MGCDAEREAAEKRRMEPIFVADQNNPDDMRQMREIFGAEALAKAFGPDGRGMQEIKENAAIGSVIQLLRKNGASQVVDSIALKPGSSDA